MAVDTIEPTMEPAAPLRLFTLAEANALLPSLVPILTRLRDNTQALVTLRVALANLELVLTGDTSHAREKRALAERERPALAGKIEELAAAIEEDVWMIRALGVELKAVDQGLVDFPTERDGRVVYLCWRLGEGQIAHWHEVEAGFAGRKPIEGARG
jgi:hypothetical protein